MTKISTELKINTKITYFQNPESIVIAAINIKYRLILNKSTIHISIERLKNLNVPSDASNYNAVFTLLIIFRLITLTRAFYYIYKDQYSQIFEKRFTVFFNGAELAMTPVTAKA